jgi:protein-disulfide isomerase
MDVARPARPDPNRRYAVSSPFCSRVTPTLRQIEREYGEKIRIVFKHLPLTMHPKAPGAHAAAEAAHRQGRFWEMHDRIFANQREMSEEKYIEYAEQIGLDLEQFEADVASADIKKRIAEDMAEARRLGVTGTPGFFVNGRLLSGAQPFEAFEALIEAPGGLPESSKPRIPPTENRPPLRRSRPPQPKLG